MGGYQRGGEDFATKSTLNSTTSPLSSGATYTGTGEQSDLDQVGVMVKSDNSGRLYFDFSSDNANWDSTYPVNGFIVNSGTASFHTAVKLGRFFRVRYINDTGAQTYFRLTTYYGQNIVPSSAPLNQAINLDQDAIVTRPTDHQDQVVRGKINGVTSWNKFAYRNTLTAAAGEETIWAATGNFTPMDSAETFDISYNNLTDGADAGATGAKTLAIYYIDSDGNPAIGSHTLGSDGSDTTSFSGFGINRVAVSSTGSSDFNVNNITITATTSGTTQAFIPASESVTQQAIFVNGGNHICIAKFLFFNVNKLSGSNPKVTVKGYVYNRNVSTRYEIFRYIIDTQSETTVSVVDPIGFRLNQTDVLYFVADTDQNNTVISLRFSLNQYQET